jgi:hypothetical protein
MYLGLFKTRKFITKRLFYSALFLALFNLVLVRLVHGGTILYFSQVTNSHLSSVVCEEILRASLAKLNIKLETKELPSSRGLLLSSSGVLDGEVVRSKRIDGLYPHLIGLSVACDEIPMFIYVDEKVNLSIIDWQSIPKQFLVGYPIGGKYIAKQLANQKVRSLAIDSKEHMFKLLRNKRIDAFISSEIDDEVLVNNQLKKLSEPISHVMGYIYLHDKNESLLLALTSELIQMKNNGELDKIKQMVRSVK